MIAAETMCPADGDVASLTASFLPLCSLPEVTARIEEILAAYLALYLSSATCQVAIGGKLKNGADRSAASSTVRPAGAKECCRKDSAPPAPGPFSAEAWEAGIDGIGKTKLPLTE